MRYTYYFINMSAFLLCLFNFAHAGQQKPLLVVHQPRESPHDTRVNYVIDLLKTALEKTVATDGPYVLRPSRIKMTPSRYHENIRAGGEPNVIVSLASKKAAEELLPIRIPIRKGLYGYRLLLINQENQPRFSQVETLAHLKQFNAGLRKGWKDVDVLKYNGFKVTEGNSYEGLFRMLVANRFDYLSRSVIEIYEELEARQSLYPKMVVEKTLLLYYPLPLYFVVNKNNKILAARLEKGLNIMLADGSFDEIFCRYSCMYLERINLEQRKIFRLENPLLEDNVPFARKDLWWY